MKQFLEVFVFVVIGLILLWFGFTLFFTYGIPALGGQGRRSSRRRPKSSGESTAGEPQTCPVCSAKLRPGELVSSAAFPSLNGGKDRFMHIRGCLYCLRGGRDRICPVCGTILKENEFLISRLFERPGRRSHVHIVGCTRCPGPGSQRKS
jgi:RNA polymerase subunit RPABC4/transcription elongation factor Spt4